MVERLLELKGRMDEVVAVAFGRSEAFAQTLKVGSWRGKG